MPIVPGVEVFGTPGWLVLPGLRFGLVVVPDPVPMPVVVEDDVPGAGVMPAEPGFCGVTAGLLVAAPAGAAPVAEPAELLAPAAAANAVDATNKPAATAA